MLENVKTVEDDLLLATDEVICHQTNCSSAGAKGLAKAIFRKFPHANTYKNEEQRLMGSCDILGNGDDERFVANLNAQYYPGKPTGGADRMGDRSLAFSRAMVSLSEQMKFRGLTTVGIPFKIGCGLAGGYWPDYFAIITAVATYYPEITYTIYKRQRDF